MKQETPSFDAAKFALLHRHDKVRAVKRALALANSYDSRILPLSVLVPFFLLVLAIGQTSPQGSKGAPSPAMHAAAGASTDSSKYVGAETCKTCHEEIYNGWEKSPHWKTTLNEEASPSKQGCEACHGPGAEHVEGGGDKTKIFVFADHSRQETSARRLTCHGEGHEQAHFSESAHSSSKVGCLDCHSPHHAKEKRTKPSGGSPSTTTKIYGIKTCRSLCLSTQPFQWRRGRAGGGSPQRNCWMFRSLRG
jgi:hypothetical protein